MKSDFSEKVVLVTGGGRGIGRATALEFATHGARVVITSRTVKELYATVKAIRTQGGTALAVAADVSSQVGVNRVVAKALQKFGAIDVLVNNAGVLEPIGPFWLVKPTQWRKNLRVNVDGVYLYTRAVIPALIAHGGGHIINVSSGAARGGVYGWSAYSTSKAAVDALTRTMAVELKEHNIHVNIVYPGIAETRMQQTIRAVEDDAMGERAEWHRQRFARGENAPPEHPAKLIVWLAQQTDVTGQVIDINDPQVKERAGL